MSRLIFEFEAELDYTASINNDKSIGRDAMEVFALSPASC